VGSMLTDNFIAVLFPEEAIVVLFLTVEQLEVDQMSHVQFCQAVENSATTIVNCTKKCDQDVRLNDTS